MLKKAIKKALASPAKADEWGEIFDKFEIEDGGRDYAGAIACVGVLKAAAGDKAWAAFIRDAVEDKPKEESTGKDTVVIVDDIS